jgi:hypothetical protein
MLRRLQNAILPLASVALTLGSLEHALSTKFNQRVERDKGLLMWMVADKPRLANPGIQSLTRTVSMSSSLPSFPVFSDSDLEGMCSTFLRFWQNH